MEAAALERMLPDERATAEFGQDIAAALRAGDVILLEGDLGAGKTTLARALVRALAGDPELEVPSPTFTLVQTYATRVPVAHVDLYRVGSPDEVDELGLDEAVRSGAVVVEWPQRAAGRLPGEAATIALSDHDAGRIARIRGPKHFIARLARSLEIRAFLDTAGWPGASRTFLTGDASARGYEVVSLPGQPDRIVMNAPASSLGAPIRDGRTYAEIAHIARSVHAFVAVDRVLADAGLAVPEIEAADLDRGLLLIGHLGDGTFLDGGEPVAERYVAAAALLADMHGRTWPQTVSLDGGTYTIPPYDREAMLIEAELLLDWYLPFATGKPVQDGDRADFRAAWNAVLDRLAGCETSIVLRDYHSPNIIWRPERLGRDRLGVIDFQDALIGPAAYDVASLALDARVTIPLELERATVEAYAEARSAAGAFDRAAFDAAYAIMGTQRNSKILGIFVRLDRRDGKPAYLRHLPRIRAYLARSLPHPALAEVRDLYARFGLGLEPAP
jgi:tRNA threonylcarbamoyl adenosine modification protein YjeE